MQINQKIRLWVLMPGMTKNLVFHTTRKAFMNTFNFIQKDHSQWEQIRVYDKNEEGGKPLKTFYNYNNKKDHPIDIFDF